jgi:hypothetical protein
MIKTSFNDHKIAQYIEQFKHYKQRLPSLDEIESCRDSEYLDQLYRVNWPSDLENEEINFLK